eukprot:gene20700-biopygen17087
MATRGLRRIQVVPSKQKMPITPVVLTLIRSQLDLSVFDDIMLWAACLTAFFGFLRASEFTVPPEGFLAARHLTVADITTNDGLHPDRIFMNLKFSKTDQFGKGCSIVLTKSGNTLCPVLALFHYPHVRGSAHGPLFHWENYSPLTKGTLNTRLQHVLRLCGWPKTFTLHSFRVGAATTAASLGFPDYLIKALGRWSSDAYQVYYQAFSKSTIIGLTNTFALRTLVEVLPVGANIR